VGRSETNGLLAREKSQPIQEWLQREPVSRRNVYRGLQAKGKPVVVSANNSQLVLENLKTLANGHKCAQVSQSEGQPRLRSF
jgi:hypothetical protein